MKNLYLDILRRREFMLSILSKEILVQNERAILNELCRMAEKRGLLGVEYDGRVSSGYEFETTKEELEGMTTCDWRKFFRTLEERDKLKITTCWVVRYDDNGIHKFHRDKRMNTHRWIISLGCMGKEFWLRCSDGQVRHKLCHGSVVIMNKNTSGNKSGMQHSGKGNAGRSWAVIIETKPM